METINYKPVKTQLEAFNFIVSHLIKQGEKSETTEGCRYLTGYEYEENTEKDLQCAVGCLINFNYYSDEIEGMMIHNPRIIVMLQDSNPELLIDNTLISMLEYMQFIHDRLDVNIWFYISYLFWRDMNTLTMVTLEDQYDSSKVNDHLEGKVDDFPLARLSEKQRNMYAKIAEHMHKADIIHSLNMKESFKIHMELGYDASLFFFKNTTRMESLCGYIYS